MSRLITIDAETYWNRAAKFSLTNMTATAYIRDPQFQEIGWAAQVEPIDKYKAALAGSTPAWHDGRDSAAMHDWLVELGMHRPGTFVVTHNGAGFDYLILGWRHGIIPWMCLDTLQMSRVLYGKAGPGGDGNSLKAIARAFVVGGKGTEVLDADGKRLDGFTDAELQRYGAYCCNDVALTAQIARRLIPQFTEQELRVMSILSKMSAQARIVVDVPMCERALAVERERKARLLSDMAATLGCQPQHLKDALMSNNKFAALLTELGIDPPMKVSKTTGKPTFAFAKNDPEMMELADCDDELVADMVRLRVGIKTTLAETRLEHFIDVGNSGPMPAGLRYGGAHCVPGETEVLTQQGWVALTEWQGGSIAQWNAGTGEITFAPAERYVGPMVDEWVVPSLNNYRCPMTLGHRVPVDGGRISIAAEELLVGRKDVDKLVVAGVLQGGGSSLTAAQVRVLVMLFADGNWNARENRQTTLRFKFKKPRKVARCAQLLDAAGINYTRRPIEASGATTFYVAARNIPGWIPANAKHYGAWVLELSFDARQALLEEVTFWDGRERADGLRCYCSSSRADVEWVATVGHLTGHKCGAVRVERDARVGSAMYAVSLRGKHSPTSVCSSPQAMRHQHSPMRAYCTKTQTGYWLARYDGAIFITGNTGRVSAEGGIHKCQLQNLPSRGKEGKRNALRMSLRAPPGHVLCGADSSQIEVRVLSALAGEDILLDAFEQNVDPYLGLGPTLFGREITKADKHERNITKAAVLAAGYKQGARGFASHCARNGVDITAEMAARTITAYRELYRGIGGFWQQCGRAIRTLAGERGAYAFGQDGCITAGVGELVLPSGRRLEYQNTEGAVGDAGFRDYTFWEKHKGFRKYIYDGLLTENITQAVAYDVVAWQAMNIEAELDDVPVLFTHDELVYCIAEHEVGEARKIIERWMSTTPPWLPAVRLACEWGQGETYADV